MLPRLSLYFTRVLASFGSLLAITLLASEDQSLRNLSPERDLLRLSLRKLDLFGDFTVGRIHTITQGPDGFMWIGTRQGLFRYDGYRVREFRHDPHLPNTLPDDDIRALHFDSKGRLWIGTTLGISLYQPELENFTSYLTEIDSAVNRGSNQVNAILHSSDGTLYASSETGIVYQYDEEVDAFTAINGKPFGTIKSMTIDPANRLWIGANRRLSRYELKTGDRRVFTSDIIRGDGVSSNYINCISYVSPEEIWLGTSNNGLVLLNSQTGETSQDEQPIQRADFVNQVNVDPQGRVWSASNAGLSIYDRQNDQRTFHRANDKSDPSFPQSGVTAMWADHQGSLWLGSNYDGISLSSRTKRFQVVHLDKHNPDISPNAPAAAIIEDREENLWVGYPTAGIAVYQKNGTLVKKFLPNPNDPNSISEQPVLSVFQDSRGDIWMGTYRGGLFKHTPGENHLTRYVNDPDNPYSIGGHDIRDIAEDANGDLWLATHGSGLIKYEISSERFYNYSRGDDSESGISIVNDWINSVLVDDQQRIWFTSSSGVTRINPERTQSIRYQDDRDNENSLSSTHAIHAIQNSKGTIWIATNNGLNRYQPETDDFKSYSVSDGIPHRSISSIVEDDEGILWLGTLDGLARFDPETETARGYKLSDGLASNDFFEGSVAKGTDGTLYFGQPRGLIRFQPAEIRNDTHEPNVFITGIRVYGTPLEIDPSEGEVGKLQKSVLFTESLTLSRTQNAITIEFTAIDYISPSENTYRYLLEGFDNEWRHANFRPEVTYTNLHPGSYIFRVQAANKDGYWNEVGDSLAISIYPPFWGTIWFRVLLSLLVVAVPAILVLWRINNIKEVAKRLEIAVSERTADLLSANRRLEEANTKILSQGEILERTVNQRTEELEIAKSKAEHSDKLKSAFLANMSHEIRTPMNAIIGFLHILDNKDISDVEREQFNHIIRQSSKSLMALIDDILDLSAIEAGEAEISPQPCNVGELCDELGALFRESLSQDKKNNVDFRLTGDVPDHFLVGGATLVLIDPLRLKQILWNLISNSIKFTDEGEIHLGYSVSQDKEMLEKASIEFIVQDTGIGIPKEEHQQIFNRFHKLDKAGKKLYRGTGLGLAITQTLTQLMEGRITVDSTPGLGTTFKVTFPFNPVEIYPQKSPSLPTETGAAQADFSDFNILVVEDEAPNYEYIERVLQRTGARIHWAENGREALDIFASRSIHLILLDLKIPEIDGFEVARRIRAINQSVPIIAQSAYAMREDHLRSSEAGANEHLAKPFSPDVLINTLSRYLLQSTT
ncbi:Two component regulator three Y motif family [Verrucomicrobiia bacterium DG1235]|nr:Two component regulator three Y motif family [Verrucomicrobiae bacterium DG1235]